jgi:V8-like Glu-specific endopeptidase
VKPSTRLNGAAGLLRAVSVTAFGVTLTACAGTPETTAERQFPTVYGSDSRQDYFEVESVAEKSTAAGAMVALISNQQLAAHRDQLAGAPAWGTVENLCPGEPFAEQPSLAFCSGVLVDWDLVLSAGHCARALPVADFSAVFDFYYESFGTLAYTPASVAPVSAIVAERLDDASADSELDYAWFRLTAPVSRARRPMPVHTVASDLREGDPLVVMGYGGGIPLKIDHGATVRHVRAESMDYFSADADTFSGASGGAALDEQLVLTGITSRGQQDLQETERGCQTAVRIAVDASNARQVEDFTFAYRALEGLCRADPDASSLCRQDCGDPCVALPLPEYRVAGGCALTPVVRTSQLSLVAPFLGILFWSTRRRSRAGEYRAKLDLRS